MNEVGPKTDVGCEEANMSARAKTIAGVVRGAGFTFGVAVVPLVLFDYLRAVLTVSGGFGA